MRSLSEILRHPSQGLPSPPLSEVLGEDRRDRTRSSTSSCAKLLLWLLIVQQDSDRGDLLLQNVRHLLPTHLVLTGCQLVAEQTGGRLCPGVLLTTGGKTPTQHQLFVSSVQHKLHVKQ